MNRGKTQHTLKILFFLVFLYLFFVSIELMSETFKESGKEYIENIISPTSNPVIGLLIGILATSIVQSSSCTTSILVGLVAAGTLPLENAIPVIMGANIGTTITNLIVSMGHISRKREFSLALAGATVHDFFNLLSVTIFLPIELVTHFIQRSAQFLSHMFKDAGGLSLFSPLKMSVKPTVRTISWIIEQTLQNPSWLHVLITITAALFILFVSLKYMVRLMKILVIGKAETLIHHYVFNSAVRSFLLGLALTATIQSSSATTSLVVPIVGAGILTVDQIFPFVLGTNIGTTITAILATMVIDTEAALSVAFAHLCFNISGTILLYPLRIVPITLAKKFGSVIAQKRVVAPLILIIFFFIIPLFLIWFLDGGI